MLFCKGVPGLAKPGLRSFSKTTFKSRIPKRNIMVFENHLQKQNFKKRTSFLKSFGLNLFKSHVPSQTQPSKVEFPKGTWFLKWFRRNLFKKQRSFSKTAFRSRIPKSNAVFEKRAKALQKPCSFSKTFFKRAG